MARRSTKAERFIRWCRRNPLAASLAGGLAAVLVVASVVSSYYAIEANRRARAAAAAVAEKDQALHDKDDALRVADDKEQLQRQRFYAAEMTLAQQALAAGDVARVLDLLENHRPLAGERDLRGFEWYYLWQEIHPGLRATFTPTDGLYGKRTVPPGINRDTWAVSVSTDGSTVAVGYVATGKGYGIKLWDANTGRPKGSLPLTKFRTTCLAYSPDGKMLASGSQWGPICLWNAADGTPIGQSANDAGFARCLSFTPDGNRLAVAGDGVVIYDVSSREPRRHLEVQREFADSIVYSPDGARLYAGASFGDSNTGSQRFSRIYDMTSQPPQVVRELKDTTIWDVAPDGRFITASNFSTNLLLDANDGTTLREFSQQRPSGQIRFTADGKTLIAAGADRTLSVWDVETCKLLCRLPHPDTITGIAAAKHDYDTWASLSDDGTIKTWHARPPANLDAINARRPNRHMVAMPGGRSVILMGDKFPAQVWSLETGKRTDDALPANDIRAVSADGTWMASVDRFLTKGQTTVRVWNQAAGRPSHVLPVPHSRRTNNSLSVHLSPNGHWVAGYQDWINVIHVYELPDTPTGTPARKAICYPHPAFSLVCPVLHVQFSPDSNWLAAAHQFGIVNLYNLQTGQIVPVPVPPAGAATQVAFSSDGRYLASGSDTGVAYVFDMQSAEVIASFPGHESGVASMAFFPGDRTLAVGSRGTIRLWDLPARQERITLRLNSDATQSGDNVVAQIAIAPNGAMLMSRQTDGAVRVWRAPGNLSEASTSARPAASTISNDPQFVARRAIAQVALGHDEQAVSDLREARRLDIQWTGELLRLLRRALPRDGVSTSLSNSEAIRMARDVIAGAQSYLDDPEELNGLAWDIVGDGASAGVMTGTAVQLAQKAVHLAPGDSVNLNTLGVAQYRAGRWDEAIASLTKSRALAADRHMAFDGFFLAMAHWQLGHKDEARTWYDRSVEWMHEKQSADGQLTEFRAEAEQTLGIAQAQTP